MLSSSSGADRSFVLPTYVICAGSSLSIGHLNPWYDIERFLVKSFLLELTASLRTKSAFFHRSHELMLVFTSFVLSDVKKEISVIDWLEKGKSVGDKCAIELLSNLVKFDTEIT